MAAMASAGVVAATFVKQYYTLLNAKPKDLHRFYKDESIFNFSVEPENPHESTAQATTDTVVGQKAIHEKIMSLEYEDWKAFISAVDSQRSLEGGVIVMVTGHLKKDAARKKFAQTFFLAPQPNGYFVRNDIFRYLSESAPTSDAPIAGVAEVPVQSAGISPAPVPVTAPVPVAQPTANGIAPTAVAPPAVSAPAPVAPAPPAAVSAPPAAPPAAVPAAAPAAPSPSPAAAPSPVPAAPPAAPAPAAPAPPEIPASSPSPTPEPAVAASPAKKTYASVLAALKSGPAAPQAAPAPPAARAPPAYQQAPRAAEAPPVAAAAADDSDSAAVDDGGAGTDGEGQSAPARSLFVRGIPYGLEPEREGEVQKQLFECFSKFGRVDRATVKAGKAFAFVDFATPEAALKAVEHQRTNPGFGLPEPLRIEVELKNKSRDGFRGRGGRGGPMRGRGGGPPGEGRGDGRIGGGADRGGSIGGGIGLARGGRRGGSRGGPEGGRGGGRGGSEFYERRDSGERRGGGYSGPRRGGPGGPPGPAGGENKNGGGPQGAPPRRDDRDRPPASKPAATAQ